jgi:hypothetical protein
MFTTRKKYKELEEKYDLLQKKFKEFVDLQLLPPVVRMEVLKNAIEIQYEGPIEVINAWAQLLTKAFVSIGANNYTETIFKLNFGHSPDEFICTIQKLQGKSPHQLKQEAEEKIRVLENKISKLEK